MEEGVFAHGYAGTWPDFVRDYFINLGYEVIESDGVSFGFDDPAKDLDAQTAEADANIYFYMRPSLNGHYVAFTSAIESGGEEEEGPAYYKFYNAGTQKGQRMPDRSWREGDDEKEKYIWDFDGADDVRTLKEVMDADKKFYYRLISVKKKK